MVELQGEMERDFNTGTVCKYKDPADCKVRLDQIEEIFATTQDPKELLHYFTAWHDKMSEKTPPSKYHRFVQYKTEMAKANSKINFCRSTFP